MSLIYIDKVSNPVEFEAKVRAVASRLGVSPNDLMLIMNMESGVNPQAQNTTYLVGGYPATGLIQIIQSTALALGTTVDDLYKMDDIEQMDYVYKYFAPYTGKIKNLYDLYMITFFPAALGYSDDQCIGTDTISCEAVAKSNPNIDINGDGKITVAEFKQYVDSRVPTQYSQADNAIVPSDVPLGFKTAAGRAIMAKFAPVTSNAYIVIVIFVLFLALILLIVKKIIG